MHHTRTTVHARATKDQTYTTLHASLGKVVNRFTIQTYTYLLDTRGTEQKVVQTCGVTFTVQPVECYLTHTQAIA